MLVLCFVIVALLFIALTVLRSPLVEMFALSTRLSCPTRNMSYDLRGEAYYPPRPLIPTGLSPLPTIGPLDPSMCY